MPEKAIETDRLTKRYGALKALDDCTFEVAEGEVFGLLGPNGAGKTTLLRLLLDFLRPTAGRALIQGLDCRRHSLAVRSRVAYLPGEVRLFRRLRGREALEFFASIRPQGNLSRALRLAERLDVELDRQLARCSTGMRQKIALAAVLSLDTPLVILDEPTTSLDPTARHKLLDLVQEMKTAGRTVVFSSHVLSEVEEACDRVAILRQGRLVHTQEMSQLRRRHRVRARLTGQAPEAPAELAGVKLVIEDRRLFVETEGELAPVLRWLGGLPLEEVEIEPVGLKPLYEQHHPREPHA